jgi:hypothetical protein
MSFELQTEIVNVLMNDVGITGKVGKDTAGVPAIFPYHHRDADARVPYPHITIARFGNRAEHWYFDEMTLEGLTTKMDNPRIAICVWSTNSVNECWRIYRLIDGHMRGPSQFSNQYFSSYTLKRTALRDDLFDNDAKAYHIHAEFCAVIQLTGVLQ